MMFRSALWRNDRNKIRASFRLEFHATQVVEFNGDKLMVSLVPSDVGKPIVMLEKAAVVDGKCRWENAAYETVKFGREPKSGKLSERICQFIVSAGSGSGGFVGEASLDLADYAEGTKGSSVPLPLKNSSSNAILHVFIQRLPEGGEREPNDNKDSKVTTPDRSSRTRFSYGSKDESNHSVTSSSAEDRQVNKTSPNTQANGICRASSVSDLTATSSDSSSEMNTPRENGVGNSIIQRDHSSVLLSMSRRSLPNMRMMRESMPAFEEENVETRWDSFSSFDGESVVDRQEADTKEGSRMNGDDKIEKLKAELAIMARQAEFSNLELQTLRKQIIKECKRSQDLSREIVELKEERDALNAECDSLRAFRDRIEEARTKNEVQFDGCGDDMQALLAEARQELNFEKIANADLRIQLQKMQESNEELILAVKDLDELLLLQKNHEVCTHCSCLASSENHDRPIEHLSRNETDDDEEQKALEELVKEHQGAKEAHLLEQRILDLSSEIEIYMRDRDELEMQMEQLALDYEILKQTSHEMSVKLEQNQLQEQLKLQYDALPAANFDELQAKIESLESELSDRSKECSDSIGVVRELEARIKSLEKEIDRRGEEFVSDLEAVTCTKVEQERRAIQAEQALAKLRRNNVDTAERLQEEFRRLFEQMASTFDANEKLAMRSLAEVGDLRAQKDQLEEMLRKANAEMHLVRNGYEQKLLREKAHTLELVERAEMSRKEAELLVRRADEEKSELEYALTSTKKQLEDLLGELERLKESKEECDGAILSLNRELRTVRVELNDSKNSLIQSEIEKEYLQAQVFLLKGDIKRKTEELKEVEKKLQELSARAAEANGGKESKTRTDEKELPVSDADEEMFVEDKGVCETSTADDTCPQSNSPDCVAPVICSCGGSRPKCKARETDLMAEENESMEAELKELQEKYSEMSLKFAVVEGERQRLVMALRTIKSSKKT
ncbi:hypothetical protein MLD38_016524 [Melastoma candidum]|uniref:Uncharacterized protein n=1 Tax=Melastoma candidum TaxID=119954 RepID=A0ACB9QNV8_9MYRT|nr:hypothetical protein MLD38_016524 [Melastoma candidum]